MSIKTVLLCVLKIPKKAFGAVSELLEIVKINVIIYHNKHIYLRAYAFDRENEVKSEIY